MLVLLADVGFTVYHSCYQSREVIGNSARVRSEMLYKSARTASFRTRRELREIPRQAMYMQRNAEAPSRDLCCSGKAKVIAHSECVLCSLSYPACSAQAPSCHPWSPRLYITFPYYFQKGAIFEKKKNIEHKMCFDFMYNFCL
jgi:hypothetical protein